jgi:Arc/MetJ family transcription regulator
LHVGSTLFRNIVQRQIGTLIHQLVPLMLEYEADLTRTEHLAACRACTEDVSAVLDELAFGDESGVGNAHASLLWDPNDRGGPHDTHPPNRVSAPVSQSDAQKHLRMVYNNSMRTNIDINESLVRKARKLTRLKTKRQIVDKALQLLVRSESRKGILRYYGSGIWKGDPKAMRRNRV